MSGEHLQIGVCLSGGGFRASLFGLGALRYLAEADLLRQTQVISAVSGGSVTAAVVAEAFPRVRHGDRGASFVSEVHSPMVCAISRKNMRNRGIARWALTRAWRFRSHGSALGATMARHLLVARTIRDLPTDLQVLLTSCDLNTGLAFRVSQEFLGGYHYDYSVPPARLQVGDILAASTAVPLLFPPVQLKTSALGLRNVPSRLSLVDGGVYDNSGLEWFQGWESGRPPAAREANFVIVVDAGGQLERVDRRIGWARSVRRSQAVQYRQSRASRTRWFVDALLAQTARGFIVPISAEPRAFRPPAGRTVPTGVADDALPEGFAAPLAGLRTDLDRFTKTEAALLSYHGYWSTHVRMATLHPEFAVGSPSWTEFAKLSNVDAQRFRKQLARGAKMRPVRFSR